MSLHGGDQPGVVSVLAFHFVGRNQISPMSKHTPFIKQRLEHGHPFGDRSFRTGNVQTEPIGEKSKGSREIKGVKRNQRGQE